MLARHGVPVQLWEMRPGQMTPAHTTGHFAELVCSNSFKSKSPDSPAGLLKAEMEGLGSIVLQLAHQHSVPGGQALAVDREAFGAAITDAVRSHPSIEVVEKPFTPQDIEDAQAQGDMVVLATGPLTSPDLSDWLATATGRDHLHFYDAVAPTVEAASLDRSIVFAQSRYDKGEGDDYLNCPFSRGEYDAFVTALVSAERAPIHAFEAGGKRDLDAAGTETGFLEKVKYFAGCTPIEAIAEKGHDSLRFGNFKPVGLTDPRTGRRPWAALQLRPENREKTLYSLVACQTRLKWGEQKRVLGMVPGLGSAEFVRFGVIHRNTYVNAPEVLSSEMELHGHHGIFLAGQLTGVEGYVESAANGQYVGLAILHRLRGAILPKPPRETAFGSLLEHLQDDGDREFAPMNINWGLLPEPVWQGERPRKVDKGRVREMKLLAARTAYEEWRRVASDPTQTPPRAV